MWKRLNINTCVFLLKKKKLEEAQHGQKWYSSNGNWIKGLLIMPEDVTCSLGIVRENIPCNLSKLHSESKAGNGSELTQFKLATWTRDQFNTKHSWLTGDVQSWRLAHILNFWFYFQFATFIPALTSVVFLLGERTCARQLSVKWRQNRRPYRRVWGAGVSKHNQRRLNFGRQLAQA